MNRLWNCPECGGRIVRQEGGTYATQMRGFTSTPGHNHDPNCMSRVYWCENEHRFEVPLRRRCADPHCNWAGPEAYPELDQPAVDEWPVLQP